MIDLQLSAAALDQLTEIADRSVVEALERLEADGIVLARLAADMRQCPICRFRFVPTRSDQKYCRPACRQKAYEQRKQ